MFAQDYANFFLPQYRDLSHHAIEATVSILGISNPALRQHLVNELSRLPNPESHRSSGFMGDPVFDVLFPWQSSELQTDSLSYLHPKTRSIIAQDIATPYKHQHQVWQTLTDREHINSAIITSGTGSGKTECFLVPILDDLVRLHEESNQPLTGVHALFLYPLNALINSQKTRLDKWTSPFNNNIRYCLYNGNTPNTHKEDQPHEVQGRETLRKDPPPILVTNTTMLEYMLIRHDDAPILELSQGKLRWIVLDEAHSYTGSTATEMSLLLRRVMLAFGVRPHEVHFVATSATIGDDKQAEEKLRKFLTNLTGAPADNIHVIGAKRFVPNLPSTNVAKLDKEDLLNIDQGIRTSPTRFEHLCANPIAQSIRKYFTQDSNGNPRTQARSLSELLINVAGKPVQKEEIYNMLGWLDLLADTKPSENEPAFLPLRGHLFGRSLMGLYACANPNCQGKHDTPLADTDSNDKTNWAFGYVYTEKHTHCRYCHFPVFELRFCDECNTPHLIAQEKLNKASLSRHLVMPKLGHIDDFVLNDNITEDEDGNDTYDQTEEQLSDSSEILADDLTIIMPLAQSKQQQSLSPNHPVYEPRYLNKNAEIFSRPQQEQECAEIAVKQANNAQPLADCSFCHSRSTHGGGQIRGAYLGAPFYISESVPTLLNFCPSHKSQANLPYFGKRMISFTDSRQGTARITMKIRQDSEKRHIRSKVYYLLANSLPDRNNRTQLQEKITEKLESLRVKQEDFARFKPLVDSNLLPPETLNNAQKDIHKLEVQIQELKHELEHSHLVSKSWSDVCKAIVNDSSGFEYLKNGMAKYAHLKDKEIAHILLLNELAKRPKKQPSLETMGLVHLHYPKLKTLTTDNFDTWKNLGLNDQDWHDYLKLLLDFFVRDRGCFALDPNSKNAASNVYLANKELYFSNGQTIPTKQKWLSDDNNKHRLVKLLCLATQLDPSVNKDKDKLNKILSKAWEDLKAAGYLTSNNVSDGITMYQLDFDQVELALTHTAFACPITHRLLDTTLRGLTPYIPYALNLDQLHNNKAVYQCQSHKIPCFTISSDQEDVGAQATHWLANNQQIKKLRDLGLWTDIADAVITNSLVIVTEEHSAQIDTNQLKRYEESFNKGETNLLNCSTTMEMGVDIDGISSVIMNNAPPHPTNYLQRTGRAGRRGESRAIAFTLCKHNPHEQQVFHHTRWAFDTQINPATINFSSRRILQSHINAWLIAPNLRGVQDIGNSVSLSIGAFFFNHNHDGSSSNALYEDVLKKLAVHDLGTLTNLDTAMQADLFKNTRYLYTKQSLGKLRNMAHDATVSDQSNHLIMGIQYLLMNSPYVNISKADFVSDCMTALDRACWHFASKILSKAAEYKQTTDSSYRKKLGIDAKQILQDNLIASLSRVGFLPRHGFPSGLVEFNTKNKYEVSKAKDNTSSKHSESPFLPANKAVRDIAIALHEYSPGNQVVIDGQVYESTGIGLTHYINAKGDAQKIASYARCTNCGALNHNQGALDKCHSCGESLPRNRIYRYLEPTGFSVDYYAKPTNKIERLSYIPAEDPLIQAGGAIMPLFHPQLGSYRTDSSGTVLYRNKGKHGNGHFVCLRCGRAKPAPSGDEAEIRQALKEFLKEHKPMRPVDKDAVKVGDKGSCHHSGYEAQHVHLASIDKTDIFELYLINPATGKYFTHHKEEAQDSKMLYTLAIALKEALARCLGVDSQEIGAGIKPIKIKRQNAIAIYLYDKAAGGAGFASHAHAHLIDILKHARQILDCQNACDDACEHCLISHDTRFVADRLDRKLALRYLDDIRPYLQLPDSAKIFAGAQYCPISITERVAQALNHYHDITLYLQGDVQDWALMEALDAKLHLWSHHQKTITIAIEKSTLNQLKDSTSSSSLRYLGFLNYSHHFNLATWQKEAYTEQILLQLSNQDATLTLGTTDVKNSIPNAEYWRHPAIIVESTELKPIPLSPFDVERYLTKCHSQRISTDRFVRKINLTRFGRSFWAFLLDQSPDLANKFKTLDLMRIVYSDRYACPSPQSVLLLQQFLYGICYHANNNTRQQISITIESINKENNSLESKKLWHNWKNHIPKNDIKKFLYQNLQLSPEQVNLNFPDLVPHDRFVKLEWSDKSYSLVDVGWGLGFLRLLADESNFSFDRFIVDQLNKHLGSPNVQVTKGHVHDERNTCLIITADYQP